MRFKVTERLGVGLCAGCRDAQTVEYADGQTDVWCHTRGMEPRLVAKPVRRCNDFDDRSQPARYQMEKIAWTVRTDKSGQTVGFAPPKKKDDDE